MKCDRLMAMEFSLLAADYRPVEPKIAFPEILKDLLDYVNSHAYQALIIKEQREYDARRYTY